MNSAGSFFLLDLSLSELAPVSDPFIARMEVLEQGPSSGWASCCSMGFLSRGKPGERMEVRSVLVDGRWWVAMLPLEPLEVLVVEVVAVKD